MSVQRRRFPDAPEQARLLRVLLAQDGSTTRLCEALAGGAVRVLLHRQERTREVPAAVRAALGGGSEWLERITSLCDANGRVLMDNLTFTRLDAVPQSFIDGLDRGQAPVGHLLASLYVRRQPLHAEPEVTQLLWEAVGEPDPAASRAYRIVTDAGPFMYIFEAYRAGLAA
jgi:chorismate-pyruvate lyase